MTREEFAHTIRWPSIFKVVGVVNPLLMIPQIIVLLQTQKTDGISLETYSIIIFLQFGFALHGFFHRDKILMWSNVFAGSMTVFATILVLVFRYQ